MFSSRHEQSISLRDIKEEVDNDEQSESKPLQKVVSLLDKSINLSILGHKSRQQ